MEDVGLRRPVPAGRVLGARRNDHPQPTLGRLSYETVHRIEALGAEEARGRVLCAALHAVALLDRVVPEQRNKAHQVGAGQRAAQRVDVVARLAAEDKASELCCSRVC